VTTLESPVPQRARAGRGTIADVALPVPVRRTFAYRIPDSMRAAVRRGVRVNVPFGARVLTGFVVGFDPPDAPPRLKSIRAVVDPEPLLDDTLLELTRWMAERTLCSWGEALRAALPGHTAPRRQRLLSLGEPQAADLFGAGTALADRILARVGDAEEVALPSLARALGMRPADLRDEVARLVKAGKLRVTERVGRTAPAGARRVKVVRLTGAPEDADLPARAPLMARVLELLHAAGGELPLGDLADSLAGSRGAVKRLAERGLVEVKAEDWEGRGPAAESLRVPELPLTDEQTAAVDAIVGALRAGRAETFLLHGVTGSGKTEVYLRAMMEARRLGRQSVFLVPEISLTPQTVSRLRARFGGRAAVVHSRLVDTERRRIWEGARRGDYDAVLGPRSAVFAPLPDAGVIIVDEEHDGAYKQEDAPRYHARDVAIERARRTGAVVVLGSATPDVETYHRSESGGITLLRLARRVAGLAMPEVRLVDLAGAKSVFSAELLEAIGDRLERKLT
jgi:primosomal protein N' (replication factor Y)